MGRAHIERCSSGNPQFRSVLCPVLKNKLPVWSFLPSVSNLGRAIVNFSMVNSYRMPHLIAKTVGHTYPLVVFGRIGVGRGRTKGRTWTQWKLHGQGSNAQFRLKTVHFTKQGQRKWSGPIQMTLGRSSKQGSCSRQMIGFMVLATVVRCRGGIFAQSTPNSTACAITPLCGENGEINTLNPCECLCNEGWITNTQQSILDPNMQWCGVRVELQDANSDREYNSSNNTTTNPGQVPRPSSASQSSLLETALHPGAHSSLEDLDNEILRSVLTEKSNLTSFCASMDSDRGYRLFHCSLLQLWTFKQTTSPSPYCRVHLNLRHHSLQNWCGMAVEKARTLYRFKPKSV